MAIDQGKEIAKEVSLPASDPLVLGVGGTALTANLSTGAYISETAWTHPAQIAEIPLRPRTLRLLRPRRQSRRASRRS